ncbi:MAG: ATP-dependent deoxyribonuclease subunit, partial [Phycisphaerales bacterium]|nr:ATP-dependent deoxyribonuclease subunit [Phycisphaerales bacterium]
MIGASKPKITWTPEQLAGIQTTGHSLLVSAAAGSGKTAVLAARCAHLVCDAEPPCDVDQLLVVTFTEAAAAEMKHRIETVLRERLAGRADEDDPRLVRQLALVERAQVSTLHGFCSRLLRQNFHLLGLDPGFSMLDGDEGKLLRIEVARDLFTDRYELDTDGQFGRLVRFYANGDDEQLIPHIVRIHEMLGSVVEPQDWLTRARARIQEAATGLLEKSEAGRELVKLVTDKLTALHSRCTAAITSVAQMDGLSKYTDYLTTLLTTLEDWRDQLESKGLDTLAQSIKGFSAPRLPTIKSDVPGKTLAVAVIDSVREEMKNGALAEIARFSRHEWQAGLQSIAPHANTLLDLVEEFAHRYRQAKDQTRRLDFNDLERFALQILRQPDAEGLRPSGVARGYHTQFHHVLVDEYQDINEVQDAILHLVSRECLSSNSGLSTQNSGLSSNLFCVGDVKQSIYRFRLAEPERFLKRSERFKVQCSEGQVIDLQANFRSRPPLLTVLNHLFTRLMTAEATDIEYDLSHHLHPGATFPPGDATSFSGAPVELHLL